MSRFLVLVLALCLALPLPARAAGKEFTCDTILALIGVASIDQIVQSIQDPTNSVRRDALACLIDADAPAQIVNAVQKRLGVEEDDGGASAIPWVEVDPDNEEWPEQLGSRIARQIRLVAPGEVPLVVLFQRSDAEMLLPWWYVELRDRVASSMLLSLPARSAAAESPLVLGDDADRLVDPSAREEVEDTLQNMGFRRVLLLSEAPAVGTQGIDLTFTVRPIDAGEERTSLIRAVPAGTEEATEDVRFLVMTSSTVRPGERLLAEVKALRDAEACESVEAWSDGLLVGRLSSEGGGSYLLRTTVPEGVTGKAWTISLGCLLPGGLVAWRAVDLPLTRAGGEGAERSVRSYEDDAVRAPTGRQRVKKGLTKEPGVIVGAGIGGAFQVAGDDGSLLESVESFSTFDSWSQPHTEVFGNAAYVSIPIEAALQLPGLRVGVELTFRPVVNGESIGWRTKINTFDGDLTEVVARPVWALQSGTSIGFGGRGDRFGLYIGGWLVYEARYGAATATGDETQLVGGAGQFGPGITMDMMVSKQVGMGLDIRAGALTFNGTGTAPGFAGGSLALGLNLRVFYRVL
ncbi:MAG: hypothetical protein H6732_14340 [Alphaproteobacteria bacterium]|nr:hypothetical protein [Alphaproteobacteria bacterium]